MEIIEKILGKINKRIDKKNCAEALELIQEEMKKLDLKRPESETAYAKLLQLRIYINSLNGNIDEEVRAITRSKKYPSEEKYFINKTNIRLIYGDSYSFKYDAIISTIHVTKHFWFSERGASADLIKRVDEEYLKKLIKKKTHYEKGEVILFEHKQLNTPIYLNILYYQDEMNSVEKLDLCCLENGMIKALDIAQEKRYNSLGSFALGFHNVLSSPEENRSNIAEALADKIAETIVRYFHNKSCSHISEITFGFVNYQTMNCFIKAFYHWTQMSKKEIIQVKKQSEAEKLLLKSANTRNPEYVSKLKTIVPALNTDETILLLGETGVGKSFLAQEIHKLSARNDKAFVEENCGVLRPEQTYSRLFGWIKGSFTDAHDNGVGLVEQANEGTLFLDEIGITDYDVQGMMLKFLDKGEYRRYGDKDPKKSDVRIILGTNSNLEDLIYQKKFRPDLYERITSRIVSIPPLRERKEDIELFSELVINNLNKKNSLNIRISDSAINQLKTYNWPGNIRQLTNYIEKLYNNCRFVGIRMINEMMIKEIEPRNLLYQESDLYLFEKILTELIRKRKNGPEFKITKNLIEPILAKIYIDDLKLGKKDASKILGIDGTNSDPTLDKRYKEYEAAKKFLVELAVQ